MSIFFEEINDTILARRKGDCMYIQYHKYVIRNAIKNDVDLLVSWWNDGTVMEHAGFPFGLQITREKVEKQLEEQSDASGCRLIMEYDGISIGEMCYTNLGTIVEIGIKICEKQYQNQGYGKVFLSMLIERLFQKGFEKIVLDTMIENRRAQHVYESLGFRKQGVRVDCWKDQIGHMRSAVDYCLIRQEFISYVKDLVIMDIDDYDCESIFLKMQQLVYAYEDVSTIDVGYVMQWMHKKVCTHKDWYRKIVHQHHIVGYYAVNNNELEDFYILDDYQDKGIGAQVMDEYIEANVLCVFKKNLRAIAFYKRFGFEIAEEMNTRYIMKKGR